jgi:DNA-directed RNA polymerase specialized sigma subunit
MAPSAEEALLEELVTIKKLLAYALLNKHKQEHTQSDIAAALGVSQSQVSRMFTKATPSKEK